VPGV
jgi:hypothetical protein